MPVRKNIKEKVGSAVSGSKATKESETAVDETARKVSRLATATSISAFVATACLVFSFVTHAQASSVVAETQSDLIETVVAIRDIPKGSIIKAEDVDTAQIPSKYVGNDSLRIAEDAIGSRTNVRIAEKSQVRASELNGAINTSSLSGRLSKGKKAVSIDVTTESDFAQSLLHQGDRVSLYYFKGEKDAKAQQELAHDVEVVALDGFLSYSSLTDGGKTASYSNVTVEVNSKTAVEIRKAQDDGKTIWFVLSPDVDNKKRG